LATCTEAIGSFWALDSWQEARGISTAASPAGELLEFFSCFLTPQNPKPYK
jgi:hypothetical protein